MTDSKMFSKFTKDGGKTDAWEQKWVGTYEGLLASLYLFQMKVKIDENTDPELAAMDGLWFWNLDTFNRKTSTLTQNLSVISYPSKEAAMGAITCNDVLWKEKQNA